MIKTCASASVTVVLLAGASAQAQLFQYQGLGGLALVGGTSNSVDFEFDTAVSGQIGGFDFTSFSGQATQVFSAAPEDPDEVTGFGTLYGLTPADTLRVTFAGLGFGVNPTTASVAASAEYSQGTGAFAGLSGAGDLSAWIIFTGPLTGDVGMTLQGHLIPSPGAVAIFLTGSIIGARRQRR